MAARGTASTGSVSGRGELQLQRHTRLPARQREQHRAGSPDAYQVNAVPAPLLGRHLDGLPRSRIPGSATTTIGNDTTTSYLRRGARSFQDLRTPTTYNWVRTPQNLFDQRIQIEYELKTLPTDIENYRPVYQTSTVQIETVRFVDEIVWKDVPVYETQTRLRTEIVTDQIGGRTFGEVGESIAAGNLVIDAGASLRLSGKVTAVNQLSLDAGSELTLRGNVRGIGADAQQISSEVQASVLDLHAGLTLRLDDSALIQGRGVGATVTLHTEGDVFFGGAIQAAAGGSLTEVTVAAEGDVRISGSITAESIDIRAGALNATSGSGSGNIVTDGDARLQATAGDLVLKAGALGGSINFNTTRYTDQLFANSSLSASGMLDLSALSGQIQMSSTGSGTDVVISGLLTGSSLRAEAEAGIVLATAVDVIENLHLSGAGNIEVMNTGDLHLLQADAADGFVTVRVFGNLQADIVATRGLTDRNDITLTTYQPRAAVGVATSLANLRVGTITTDDEGRGDIFLNAQGSIAQLPGGKLESEDLRVVAEAARDAAGQVVAAPVTLVTNVATMSIKLQMAGDATITQGLRRLVVYDSVLSDGAFDLTAAGSVDLSSLRITTSRETNDITVESQGDLLVRNVAAGTFVTDLSTLPVYYDANENLITPDFTSAGDVSLTSVHGAIRQNFTDASADIVADLLTLRADTGILDLDIAANTLDAVTAAGDIVLRDLDGAPETFPGLTVAQARTATGGVQATTVSIQAEGELRVPGATNAPGAVAPIKADTIRLTSLENDVVVEKGAGAPETLDYTRGVAFVAHDVVRLYRFFEAPQLMEYRAGKHFLIDAPVTPDNPEGVTRLLPANLSADTLILQTGGTLSLNGRLSANVRLELIAGQDVLLRGEVVHKATFWDGASATATDSLIDDLVITARGDTDVVRDITDGDATDGERLDEAVLTVDFNGDGDLLDVFTEGPLTVASGFLDLQLAALPAARFDLRAERDIRVVLGTASGPAYDLTLSGFIGGLDGFDAARNVRLETTGDIELRGGIVSANEVDGELVVRSATLTTDKASVFIAHRLDVLTGGGIQANTLVGHLLARSTVAGDIIIKEAGGTGGLTVDLASARDGAITIDAGSQVFVREIVNFADGDNITVKAGGALLVDRIEAGSSAGAQKGQGGTGGIITLDSAGNVASGRPRCATLRPASPMAGSPWTTPRPMSTAGRCACWRPTA